MHFKHFKFSNKKIISILCAIAVLVTTLPLNALLMPAAATSEILDFEGKNASSIVTGNDEFSLAGLDKEDKYYFYSKNNTNNTLSITFDDIKLDADKKYTLDFDVYTLRVSKAEDDSLLGIKVYGDDSVSLEETVTNLDICEENWANYHTTFTAKEKNNKLDFSLYTFGKVFIDNLVLIDEKGKETALDFAKACEKTEHPDHFSSSTLYDIAYDEVDVVDGYLKAVVPENANTIHNEGVDIPFNIGKNIEAGHYTVKLDVKFTAVGSCRNSFCVSVAGMGVDIQQKWIDAVDVTLNKYETFSYEFDLLPEHSYFRFNVYQGCTAYIDNVYLIDATGDEIVKFNFDEPVDFRGSFYEQKGIPKTKKLSAKLYRSLLNASNDSDYALYIDNSANDKQSDAVWFNLLGMQQLSLAPGKEYTLKFDNYALSKSTGGHCYVGVHSTGGGITGQNWFDTSDIVNGWATQSVKFTFTGDSNLAFHTLHVGKGFKGYLDNFCVYEGDKLVAQFDFDSSCNGKTSAGATVVALPTEVESLKNPDYAILIDNLDNTGYGELYSNELDMPKINLPAGKYKVQYDFYAIAVGNQNMHYGSNTESYASEAVSQKWRENVGHVANEWVTRSFDITANDTMVYQKFWIGAGIKGYLDNWKILDESGKVVYSYEGTAKELGKVSHIRSSVVVLPVDVANAKPAEKSGDYAIYFESGTQNNFWVTKKNASHPELGMEEMNLPAGKTYTVDFDVYALTTGSDVVFGATKGTWDTAAAIENGHQVWKKAPTSLNTWTHYSFNVTTTEEWKGVIFYVLNSGFKGYIDNLTIKENKSVVASYEPTDTTLTSNCASIVDLPVDVANAKPTEKSDDYAILIDNLDNSGYAELYSNELDMPNVELPVGKYKVQYDFYAIAVGNKHMHYNSAKAGYSGDAVSQVWRDNVELVANEWVTCSFNVTATDTMVYQKFWIGAGIKGYLDNWKILDESDKVVYNYEGTAKELGKVSHERSSVVALPMDVADAKNNTPAPEVPTTSGMKITVLRGRADDNGASIKLGGTNSPLTLESNKSYRLSFKYYQANPTDSGILNLFGIDAGFDNDIVYFKKNNTEGWANGTVYFTTGKVTDTNADWLEIILSPNAWVYFDDFKIVEQEADNNKAVSVVKFDKADDTIYPTVSAEKATFAYSNEHGGTFKVVNATEYTNTDKNSNRNYTFKGIKMKPNTTYRVSIDYYNAVPFTDYAAAFGFDQSALGTGTGASWPCYINNVTTSGWHTTSFTVTTGDVVPNGNYINLAFYDVLDSEEPRVMYFDNLSFTELYRVDTSVNDISLGTVTKTLTLEGGKDARVVANAFAGAKFEGWYEYGDLVSKEKTYRIKGIDDNHRLQAVFSGEAKPATTIVQSFEDYDLGDRVMPWYEIANNSKYVMDGKQSLHIKPDKITESIEASIFFPLVSNKKYQLKDDYTYDVYVWIKPAKESTSVTYFALVNSMSRDLSDMVYSGELEGSNMSANISPMATSALEEKNGWLKYRLGTISKKVATMDGFAFQVCKFHANRAEGASVDDLYIDRVEVVERTPDFANLKYTEKFFNEVTNSNFEEKVTNENWGPLTDGMSIEKIKNKEFDWQGNYNLKFDAEKSNGEEYVRIIPISKSGKNYTFAAWTKLSKGSDITVGLYKDGRYQKFVNIVNAQNGTLPLIDDGKWNRASFTFSSGTSTEAYLVIKGTKGTLYLDNVELFIAERGYLKDPNNYGDGKVDYKLFDPIAFPDEVVTNVTYVDNEVEDVFFEEVEEEEELIEEFDDDKPSKKKKIKVVRRRKANDSMLILWICIGSGVLLLAVGAVIFILFKKGKIFVKGVK